LNDQEKKKRKLKAKKKPGKGGNTGNNEWETTHR